MKIKKPGKKLTILFLIIIYIQGSITLYFVSDTFNMFMDLCAFVVPPIVIIMSGIALNGVVERWVEKKEKEK